MTKLINFWTNPVNGCQEVRVGDLIRPSYISNIEIPDNPSCIIETIDTANLTITLRLNKRVETGFGVDMTTTPIIITKDQLLENYGFFSKL
jgi:hypothetical protein